VYRDTLKPADEIADVLLDKILADIDYSDSEVAVLVNGSGGTPLMELYLINNHVHDVLTEKGIKICKTLVGNYMTSIEQEGFSLTLLKLDEQLKTLLDAPADTIAYKA
ncbi:MAG: dihydroxyacetone kinase subunit DhaK, partial [Ruminococcus sp.]|nr:dihydroxyacetone kinase subunit DhaK [Candidatus Copronaster equi]